MEDPKRFTNPFVFLILFVPALAIDSRSVNLALETSFLFDTQDIKENASIINKLQSVIDKLKAAFKPTPGPIFRQRLEETDAVLSKFITDIGGSILNFSDAELSKFVNDFSNVVQNQAEENVVLDRMLEDKSLKKLIVNKIKKWADMEPKQQKKMVADYLTSADSIALLKLFQMLDKLFDASDEPTFHKLRKKFEHARKTSGYEKFITKVLDDTIFNPFINVNSLMQEVFKHQIRRYTAFLKQKFKESVDSSLESNRRFVSKAPLQPPKTVASSDPSSESTQEFEMSNIVEKMSNNAKNELVFNKELQMNVHKDGAN